jgi:hypothetical protein
MLAAALSALVLGSLYLMIPATVAASGLPATITMRPSVAGPGEEVEVAGLDFPSGDVVDLQITTADGTVYLGTLDVAEGGYFRQTVTLPADAPPGFWELRAASPDGTTAVHVFESSGPPAAVPPAAPPAETTTAPAASSGNSASDIIVMLTFALLLAAVGGALAYAWYLAHGGDRQPGMAAGDDPIWSNAGEAPIWNAVNVDTPQ